MTAPITVLTISIPGREAFLLENVRSVNGQTVKVERQLILSHPAVTDPPVEPQVSYSSAKNDLLRIVETEWVAVLNDDDHWLSHHVETILPHLAGADVVYTWDEGGTRPRVNVTGWSRERLREQLGVGNVIDGNCLIRTSLLKRVGGFPVDWVGPGPRDGGHYVDSPACWEDWETWRRLLKVDARFLAIPVETWRYRMGTAGQICG